MLEQPLTVLLVEDNPGDARLIREMLREGCGDRCRLEHVDRLSLAMDRLSRDRFDLVLLDLSLPDAQGLEAFRQLHAHAPEVPVVMLTGLDDEDLARRSVQEGAQDYLPKGDVSAHSLVRSILYAVERAQGEAERAHLLAREQAARVEAEAQRARLQAILESAAHGILFVDAETGRLSANPAAERILGRSLAPDLGMEQYTGELSRPDEGPLALDELPLSRALRGATITNEELVILRPDGTEVPVLASAAPIRDRNGAITGAVVIHQDITALKELERLREEWTSVIAHDLRQPVAAISLYAQALTALAEHDGALQRIRPRAQSIVEATRRLDRMIGDLLDVSRLGAGRLMIEPVPVDLAILVRGVAQLADGHSVEISVDEDLPRLPADPGRLEQVLGNLVSNAFKYGDPGTPILIRVSRKDGEVEVAVTNQGPGIPPAEIPRIFRRFYRASGAQSRAVAGLGLGLYIARELVHAHGGRMWVESTPGETTTFRFTLPTASGL